jgi:predicted patatin/cPLA2 family phospholipase
MRLGIGIRSLGGAFCLLLAGCAALPRQEAVPVATQQRATVLGVHGLRYWADRDPTDFIADTKAAYELELAQWRAAGNRGPLPRAELLAISGGGEDGAFGAGLLCGWTAAGTRPVFKGVTGISTGALTAPLAFLGPDYDDKLRAIYTETSAADVLRQRSYLAAVLQDAAADTSPLRRTIAKYFDQKMLDAIAAEHAKGRLLLIGTTNLDARRPVIWNVTKIAASGRPGALELVQKILLASAAIPGAFPPVLIEAEIDGKPYQEMHVDGGASAQVFLYPPSFNVAAHSREMGIVRERRVDIIRNARLDPDWAQVERRTLSIVGRAVSSLIQTQGIGDLYRIYIATQRDGIDFNLAYIPETFTTPLKQPFDTAYMRELFRVGYDLAVKGYPWAKVPPGWTAPEIEPPLPAPAQGSRPSADERPAGQLLPMDTVSLR